MNGSRSIATLVALPVALALVPAALGANGSSGVRPDDRAGVRGGGIAATIDAVRPDDRPGVRGPALPATPQATIIAVAPDGFDWGSAGIGAGAGAGIVLALLGAFLFVRPQRVEANPA